MEIGFRLLLGEDPGFLPACPPAVGGLDGGLHQADCKLCVHFICSCCRPDRCQGLELPSSLASRQTCFSPESGEGPVEIGELSGVVTKAWVVVASGLWDAGWVCGFVKYPQFGMQLPRCQSGWEAIRLHVKPSDCLLLSIPSGVNAETQPSPGSPLILLSLSCHPQTQTPKRLFLFSSGRVSFR